MTIKSEIQKIEVGNRIHTIRLRLGLTLEEFGKKVGNASKGNALNWEKGKNLPNKKRLAEIAKLGHVSVDFLITGFTSEKDKEFEELSKKRKAGKIRLKLPKDSYVHTKEGNEGHFINCKENRDENYIEVTREGLDVLLNDIFKSNWK